MINEVAPNVIQKVTGRGIQREPARRGGYMLLETVIATGLLVTALAVIGAQFHDSQMAIRRMERRLRAMTLAEQQLAFLDLGLIKLDSIDEVEEGDFGPRFPDWGWTMRTEPTSVQSMFRLTIEVEHLFREDDYTEDSFDHDLAKKVQTVYVFRAKPQRLDLATDFGLTEDEFTDVAEQLSSAGIAGLDAAAFDPSVLARLDSEELLQALPVVLNALGMDLGALKALIPPEILRSLEESGAFGDQGDQTGQDEASGETTNDARP